MKTMKRIAAGLLAIGMMLAVVGCGGEEKTVTMRADMTAEMGIPSTDTMIITAKGDTIEKLKEVMEIDMSSLDASQQDAFAALMDDTILTAAEGIDGITCKSSTNNSVYSVEFTIDCTNSAAVKAAAEAGLLEIEDGFIDKLSLKKTQDGLKASGYTEVE